ncbi:MAG: hypothetical protein LUD46_14185 [Parabacteroides sp.]|nr:hypothetical protein [Parabacteroides sp.]
MEYPNVYYLCIVIVMTLEGLKARMEELIGELEFHSRFFSMILAEEMATEAELLEAIDEMLDEYIELSNQIKKLQG